MDGEIILAQAKEYTGFKPTTATFAMRSQKSGFGSLAKVAVIGLIIYVRRNKSA